MADNRHDAVWDWLRACPGIGRLFFNFSEAGDGCTAVMPTDSLLEEYLDGSRLRRYSIELVHWLPASFSPDAHDNIDMLAQAEALARWVEAQNAAGVFPAFPAGETVLEAGVHEGGSGYAAEEHGMARYVIPIYIDYLKEVSTHG